MEKEQPYLKEEKIVIEYKYNPKFGDDKICKCGHSYYRHFDSYEQMEPVGCKYCECYDFEEEDLEDVIHLDYIIETKKPISVLEQKHVLAVLKKEKTEGISEYEFVSEDRIRYNISDLVGKNIRYSKELYIL